MVAIFNSNLFGAYNKICTAILCIFFLCSVVLISCGLPFLPNEVLKSILINRSGGIDSYTVDIPSESKETDGIVIMYRLFIGEITEEEYTKNYFDILMAENNGELANRRAEALGYRYMTSNSQPTLRLNSYPFFDGVLNSGEGIESSSSRTSRQIILRIAESDGKKNIVIELLQTSETPQSIILNRNTGRVDSISFFPVDSINYNQSDNDISQLNLSADTYDETLRTSTIRLSLIMFAYKEREKFGSPGFYSLPDIFTWDELLTIKTS